MDKKYTLQGLIGCILFGVGDWLLGAVDPARVNGDVFYFISAGHGAEYPSLKITITIITAVIGVLFMHQGCTHISELMKSEKDKAGASRIFAFLTFAWFILHFVVALNVYAYSYMCRKCGNEQAVQFSQDMGGVLNVALYLSYVIIAVAFIDLILVIAKGRTYLSRREAFFTPLTWIGLIGAVSMILPESAFSKGLYTFCMNGGMIVWFVRMLFRKKPE